MNDPKEIAAEITTRYVSGGTWSEVETAIAAALQAEREDGCRRVNDAIGDRDPIIEQLKAELEIVKKQRDESAAKEASATTLRVSQQKMIETVWKQHEQQFAAMKAERDEAVRALERWRQFEQNQ